jgi:cytochrome c oxidase subunit 2
MIGRVFVLAPHDYETWLAGGAGIKTPVARGGELFAAFNCNSCHQDAGTARGPALAGLFGKPVVLAGGGRAVADDAYLRESILNPTAKLVAGYQPIMPTFRGQVTEDDLMQLIAYIKSLKPVGGAAAAAGTPVQRAGFDGEIP